MKNKRVKVGDIKLSEWEDGKEQPMICIKVTSYEDGSVLYTWEGYAEHILHTRMGMGPESNEIHTLQHFVDTLKESKSPITKKEKYIFDSDIRCITLNFIIPILKQLMGAKSAYTGKETTKIYINHVRKAIEQLEEALKKLERIKEDDYRGDE